MVGGNPIRKRWLAVLIWACACVYALTSTRIVSSLEAAHHAWETKPVAEQAIFACSIHKCQCQNALQCKAHCCCFPKGDGHAHGDEKDHLNAGLKACAGGIEEHAAPAALAPHTLPTIAIARLADGGTRLPSIPSPSPLSPIPDSPLKVPILLS